tara:strand:- start:241 stop:588 length:348 start_codon:yes stop_codon:yes gene_type:complete
MQKNGSGADPDKPDGSKFTVEGTPRMKPNPLVQRTILEIVENQLKDGDPPETVQTLERLVADGHSRQEAKKLIGAVVVMELNELVKQRQTFEKARFVRALNRLPELPFDEYGLDS